MRTGAGYALVKPVPVSKDVHGVGLFAFVDTHHYASVLGTVEEDVIPGVFFGREIEKMEFASQHAPHISDRASLLSSVSLMYDVPVEVKKGDKVIFDWKHTLKGNGPYYIRYDDLHARISEDGSVYPLNGHLLVEMLPDEQSDIYDPDIRKKPIRAAIVKRQGCLVKGYRLQKGADTDMGDLVGRKIFFRQNMAVRIEDDIVSSTGNQKPLYRIHRNKVVAYV